MYMYKRHFMNSKDVTNEKKHTQTLKWYFIMRTREKNRDALRRMINKILNNRDINWTVNNNISSSEVDD